MLWETDIFFSFKGNRSYVHGTDIFDKTLQTVWSFFHNYPTRIKGSFHHLLRNNCLLRIYNIDEELGHDTVYAYFTVAIKGSSYHVTIARTTSAITSSYVYDEREILDGIEIDYGVARMACKSSSTYMEQIVAMTKQLHLTFYPDASHKWLLSKVDIRDFVDPLLYPGHGLIIKAVKHFHYKLTQNAIFLDHHFLGNIWFSKAR